MNLFPAGFNNLNPDFLSIAIAAAKRSIQRILPTTQKIMIIPESHTRNLFYFNKCIANKKMYSTFTTKFYF